MNKWAYINLSKDKKNIETYKNILKKEFMDKKVTDVILYEFPKFSVYFKDGGSWHSFDFDIFTRNCLYKAITNYSDFKTEDI